MGSRADSREGSQPEHAAGTVQSEVNSGVLEVTFSSTDCQAMREPGLLSKSFHSPKEDFIVVLNQNSANIKALTGSCPSAAELLLESENSHFQRGLCNNFQTVSLALTKCTGHIPALSRNFLHRHINRSICICFIISALLLSSLSTGNYLIYYFQYSLQILQAVTHRKFLSVVATGTSCREIPLNYNAAG